MTSDDCDILIAGGGLVGLSLALALSGSGLRVAVVDRVPMTTGARAADERHLALSEVTCRVLENLGVLPALGSDAEPIRAIHVSSAGEFGATRWAAGDAGRSRFGMVVPARRLLQALQQAVLARSELRVLAPAAVVDARIDADGVHATVASDGAQPQSLRARLLVIADGVDSALRDAAGIGTERHDYQRSAICCALSPERDHQGTAFERFTRSGPVALLPQAFGRCGAIQVVDNDQVEGLMALPDDDYLRQLQSAFGYRLGRLRRIGLRVSYPLRRVLAQRLTAPRQVLIGNAAQAVHPVGAQGFNLGLRDAATLADCLLDAHRAGGDPGDPALLQGYAASRASDRTATTGLSHALAQFTSLKMPPAAWLRSLSLLAADRIEPLREHLMLGGMGYRGATPALARGSR
ncbi:MAG TPA: FAD-dependent monooxygenase [Xanthomonadales bacterium]|nr:FAD-dependent monooxygenase [Xanthomonadales bacterium]